jgi:hypothetical protein
MPCASGCSHDDLWCRLWTQPGSSQSPSLVHACSSARCARSSSRSLAGRSSGQHVMSSASSGTHRPPCYSCQSIGCLPGPQHCLRIRSHQAGSPQRLSRWLLGSCNSHACSIYSFIERALHSDWCLRCPRHRFLWLGSTRLCAIWYFPYLP